MRYYHYHRLPSQLLTAVNGQNHSNNPLILLKRLFHFAQSLTTQEVATALRPFIFIVHPDRFWAYPKERVTNEVSLKRLNEFLDDRLNASKAPLQTRKPEETVTFYLNSTTTTNKNEASKASAADTSAAADKHDDKLSLKKVEIKLSSRENLNTTVHRILSQCSLPTDYLKKIGKQPDPNRPQSSSSSSFSSSDPLDTSPFFRKANEFFYSKDLFEQMEAQLAKSRLESNLLNYLKTHYMEALKKLEASRPIEADLARLKAELVEALQLTDLSWTGLDWGVSHIRGALKNLAILGGQYPAEMGRLAGKRLVFSRESGIATDGAVVLSIEDVRNGWLDLIRSSPVFDPFVAALPDAERELSEQLRGISILPASEAHGDGNIKLAKRYVTQLRRFTKTMRAYAQEMESNGSSTDPFPAHWPPSLAEYRLVVEADSGPLMLSTGGHFIVPASCPASLFVRFLSENLHRASRRSVERQAEVRRTARERAAVEEVRSVFGLLGLDKDENILGEQMIDFCERLLSEAEHLRPYLRGLHIRVSMYYCVLADGQICVPFNFIPRT